LSSADNPNNRARITDRVAELLGEQPWTGYDEQNIDAIATRLEGLDVDTANQVRSYERDHKNRPEVVQAAERRIARG
jgi:hypothetical protein